MSNGVPKVLAPSRLTVLALIFTVSVLLYVEPVDSAHMTRARLPLSATALCSPEYCVPP
jgi:hypothetical protein